VRLTRIFGQSGSLQRNIVVYVLSASTFSLLIVGAVAWYLLASHLENLRNGVLRAEAIEFAGELSIQNGQLVFYGPQSRLGNSASGSVIRYTAFDDTGQSLLGDAGNIPPQLMARDMAPGGVVYFTTSGGRHGAAVSREHGARLYYVAAIEGASHPYSSSEPLWLELLSHSYWLIALAMLIVLSSAVFASRRSLATLRQTLAEVDRIGPTAPTHRLPRDGAPRELWPLIDAVNAAVSRLELGYRAQRDFAGNVAHEIRTPIAVLKSRLQARGPQTGADPDANLLDDVIRLERLSQQLLDLSRAETLADTGFADVDLETLAIEVASGLAPRAVANDTSLGVTGAHGVVVSGNAGFLRIALGNLIENALIHTAKGTDVTIRVTADPPGWRVSDRGPGVPADQRARIFRRFDRGATPPHARTGAGIGLSIVGQVVTAHGGRVGVSERPGGGAVFWIELAPPASA